MERLENENTANMVEEEEDDEAFLPPGFFIPIDKPSTSSIALEAFLDDVAPDFLAASGDGYCESDGNLYGIPPISEDTCNSLDLSAGAADTSQNDATTQYENFTDDEDAALDRKLDALAVALQEEVQAGTRMMNNMVCSESRDEAGESESVIVHIGVKILDQLNERDAMIAQQQEMIDRMEKEKTERDSEQCHGEAAENFVDSIAKLNKENAILLKQQAEQGLYLKQLDAQKSVLESELKQKHVDQAAAKQEENGAQILEAYERLKYKHQQLEIHSLEHLKHLQTDSESKLVALRQDKDRELDELRSVIAGQRAAFVEAKKTSSSIRSMQRRIGMLEANLKESNSANDAAAEATRKDQSKIRSLQRQIGHLRAVEDASQKALESAQQEICNLQRQLETAEMKVRDAKAEMSARECANKSVINAVVQEKDHEIELLRNQVLAIRRKLDSRSQSVDQAEHSKKLEIEDFQTCKTLQQDGLEQRAPLDMQAVESHTQVGQLDTEQQHDEHLLQQPIFEQANESLLRENEDLRNQIEGLKKRSIAQTAAFAGLKRLNNHAIMSLQPTAAICDDRLEKQTLEITSKDHQICDLRNHISCLQEGLQREQERHESSENETNYQKRFISLESGKLKVSPKLAEGEALALDSLAIEACYAKEATRLKSELESFARVARAAVDETNRLFCEKMATMQDIIDRQRVEIDVEKALNEVREKEATDVADKLQKKCGQLEFDLSALAERKQKMELLAKTNHAATLQLQEEYNVLEEELLEALDREEEYIEERELILADCDMQTATLQSSLASLEQSTSKMLDDSEAAFLDRIEKVQCQRDSALSRIEQLNSVLESFSKDMESTKENLNVTEDKINIMRSLLEFEREQTVADQVDLFKRCLVFFETQKECEISIIKRQMEDVVRKCKEETTALKEKHCADMKKRQGRNEDLVAVALAIPASNPTLPLLATNRSVIIPEAAGAMSPLIQSPTSAFDRYNNASRILISNAPMEQQLGEAFHLKGVKDTDVIGDTSGKNHQATVDLGSGGSFAPDGRSVSLEKQSSFAFPFTLSSPVSTTLSCAAFPSGAATSLAPRRIEKVCLDFSSPDSQLEKENKPKQSRTTPNISAAKAKLRAMEAKRHALGKSMLLKRGSADHQSVTKSEHIVQKPVPGSQSCLKSQIRVSRLAPTVATGKKPGAIRSHLQSRMAQTGSAAGSKPMKPPTSRGLLQQPISRASLLGTKQKSRLSQHGSAARLPSRLPANVGIASTRANGKLVCTTAITNHKSAERPRTYARPKPDTASKSSPRQTDLFVKLEELKASAATPLFSTSKKLPKNRAQESVEKSDLSTKLAFMRTTSKDRKTGDLLPSTHPIAFDNKRVRFHQEEERCEAAIVRKTPYHRVAQLSTPLRVGREIIDLFSPESPLVTPVRAEERLGRRQEESLAAAVRIQSTVRRFMAVRNLSMIHVEEQRRRAAIRMQSSVRRYNAQKMVVMQMRQRKAQSRAAIQIQSSIRRCIAMKLVTRMIREQEGRLQAALQIQNYVRRFSASLYYHHIRSAAAKEYTALFVQKQWRMKVCRKQFLLTVNYHRLCCASATVIQRALRMHSHRRHYLCIRSKAIILQQSARRLVAQRKEEHQQSIFAASILIQVTWRKYSCQKRFATARSLRAAHSSAVTKIQSAWRMHGWRCYYVGVIRDVCIIQSFGRRITSRRRVQARRRVFHMAAVRIQCYWRMVVCRKAIRRFHKMAATIQNVFRGAIQRSKVQQQRTAAIKIQSIMRMTGRRIKYNALRSAAVRIQCYWRMVACRDVNRWLHKTAATIQGVFRGVIQRNKVQQQRTAAIKIQSVLRMTGRRIKYSTLIGSAITVQRFVRCIFRRRTYLRQRNAICMVQSVLRMSLRRKKYLSKHKSAKEIQKLWRVAYNRRVYQRQRNAAIFVQSFFRMRVYHEKYYSLQKSVKLLQGFFRDVIQKRCGQREGTAATKIQTAWRMASCHSRYLTLYKSTVTLQGLFIAVIQRRIEQREGTAAIKIQQRWRACRQKTQSVVIHRILAIQRLARGFAARRKISINKRRIYAATIIQSHWRTYSHKRSLARILRAAISVQKIVRAFRARHHVKELMNRRAAAVTLQHRFRMIIIRKRFKIIKKSTVIIQNCWRCFLAQRQYEDLAKRRSSATVVQRRWRRFSARKLYHVKCSAAFILQTNIRKFLLQKRTKFEYQKQSAIILQKEWRMLFSRKRYSRTLSATLIVQSFWRGFLGRAVAKQLAVQNSSVVILQCLLRMNYAKTRYRMAMKSIICIQSIVRRNLARQQATELANGHRSAIIIQNLYRKAIAQKRYTKQVLARRKSCVRIQRCWRAACHRTAYTKTIYGSVAVPAQRFLTHRRLEKLKVAENDTTQKLKSKLSTPTAGEISKSSTIEEKLQRKVLGNLSITEVPKKSTSNVSRQASRDIGDVKSVFSPLKTRRGARITIVPNGENDGDNSVRTRTSQTSKSSTGQARGALVGPPLTTATDSRDELRSDVQNLKVVDLRQELKSYGVESKKYRSLRKAELVSLVVAHRLGQSN